MKKARKAVALAALAALCSQAQAAPLFADWTVITTITDVASGSIGGVPVLLFGTQIDGGVTNGSDASFSSGAFTPSLASSDVVYLRGTTQGSSYTVSFGSPLLNPVLHLNSLASTLIFAPFTSITELSDDGNLSVVGNTVTGITSGSTDANGTIQLNGLFSSFSFLALYGVAAGDGIAFQVGASEAPPPPPPPPPNGVPEPGTVWLALGALGLMTAARRRRLDSQAD